MSDVLKTLFPAMDVVIGAIAYAGYGWAGVAVVAVLWTCLELRLKGSKA